MNSLESRLFRLEMASDGIPVKPNFDNMSEEQLDKLIADYRAKFHKDSLIKSFADAKRVLDSELERDLIPVDDYNVILKGEEIYWNETR